MRLLALAAACYCNRKPVQSALLLGPTTTDEELIGVLDAPLRHSAGPLSLIAFSKSINAPAETHRRRRLEERWISRRESGGRKKKKKIKQEEGAFVLQSTHDNLFPCFCKT